MQSAAPYVNALFPVPEKELAAEIAAPKVTGFQKLAAKHPALAEGCSALESQLIIENAALVKENAALKEQATRAENAALASELKMKRWLQQSADYHPPTSTPISSTPISSSLQQNIYDLNWSYS